MPVLLGLGLVLAALAFRRRRRSNREESVANPAIPTVALVDVVGGRGGPDHSCLRIVNLGPADALQIEFHVRGVELEWSAPPPLSLAAGEESATARVEWPRYRGATWEVRWVDGRGHQSLSGLVG